MRAAILEAANQPLVIKEVTLADPGPQEVLVRTAAVGLCHSDLHLIEGLRAAPLPSILGHEVSGIVERVGDAVTGLAPGDHVVGSLTSFCGHCRSCVSGHQVHCEDTTVRIPNGKADRIRGAEGKISQHYNLSGFAEEMLVHYSSLVKIPHEMPLDRAALLGCAVLTGTGAVFRTAAVVPGGVVAVIGCGGVGLSAINGAAIAGASRIIAVDISPEKLEMARKFGATDIVNSSAADPVEAVREMTGGGVEYSFECIGLPQTTEQAYGMLAPNGQATIVGVFADGAKITIPAEGFVMQKRIQGSLMGASRLPVDIPRLVDHYLGGRLLLDELVSQHITLDRINEGFEAMKSGSLARSVIVFPAMNEA